jgi:hypothetical protein
MKSATSPHINEESAGTKTRTRNLTEFYTELAFSPSVSLYLEKRQNDARVKSEVVHRAAGFSFCMARLFCDCAFSS